MAKKERNEYEGRQTRLGPDGDKTEVRKKTKRKNKTARTVVLSLLGAVALVALIFLFVLAKYLFELFSSENQTAPSVVQHTTTSQSNKDKVGYYLIGLLGEETDKDDTAGLMLVCFDKKNGTVNFLQVPVATYLGKSDAFAVRYIGGVWANPAPLPWCETCRKRVYEPEIKDGKHTVCGKDLTEKKGSSVENLIDVFNEQYSLPVDGYFLLPRPTMAALVDELGGVTVTLSESLTVGEATYKRGDQTLDGEAAVAYITQGGSGVSEEMTRITRQRQVIVALLARLFEKKEADVQQTLKTIMDGKTPIRTDTSVKDMTALIRAAAKVDFGSMTACVIPGEAVKSGAKEYYSLNASALKELLNGKFNPYGEAVKDTDVKVEELKDPSKKMDIKEATLDQYRVQQVYLDQADSGEAG